jgi:hypothetical protein
MALVSRLPASLALRLVSLTAFAMTSALVIAQDLRDPTVAPVAATGVASPGVASPWGSEGMSVIQRDGTSWLVVGTRLVAPGQKVGSWVLERITETEVWMRDGKTLRKVPRFSGIQRSEAQSAKPCTPVAPPSDAPGKRITQVNKTTPKAEPACDATPLRSSTP